MGNAVACLISLDIFMNGATFYSTLLAAHYWFYSEKVFTVEYQHTLLCEELVEGSQRKHNVQHTWTLRYGLL